MYCVTESGSGKVFASVFSNFNFLKISRRVGPGVEISYDYDSESLISHGPETTHGFNQGKCGVGWKGIYDMISPCRLEF